MLLGNNLKLVWQGGQFAQVPLVAGQLWLLERVVVLEGRSP